MGLLALTELCARWDALSKGESMTTKAVRDAIAVEEEMPFVEPVCHKCGRQFKDGDTAYAVQMAVIKTEHRAAIFSERTVLLCEEHNV